MKKSKSKKTIKTINDVFGNPYYRGKHIVLIKGRIFTAKTGEGASKILKRVIDKYPDEIPEVAYLPKARSLILWS